MGAIFPCCRGDKSTDNPKIAKGQIETIKKRDNVQVDTINVNDNQSTNTLEPITIVHTSLELIDEDFRKQISEIIEKRVALLHDAYQVEKNNK